MASFSVTIKHSGTKYNVDIEPGMSGEDFKAVLYSLTSVEPERQKIILKGGKLADNADMSKIGIKPGQQILMMGTPGGSGNEVVRPKDPVKFVEDMTEAEQAQQVGATPPGFTNEGNTCYLNASLQTLRLIPELRKALSDYHPDPSAQAMLMSSNRDLTSQLAGVFRKMDKTQEPFAPHSFLECMRAIYPQFAERSRSVPGYAQQDAEEAFSQIVQQLRQKLQLPEGPEGSNVSFVEKYMSGEFTSVLECDEEEARNAGEKAIVSKEPFPKLNCHIDSSINHLRDGILAGLKEQLEKKSEVLDRDASYTKTSKISRAPRYLTVHFVRFFWKRDSQKKAKIMRKVTFPHELDIVEFCSDELKKALIPVRDKVREIRKDEEDIERSRKRRKLTKDQTLADVAGGAGLPSEREKKEAEERKRKKEEKSGSSKTADGDTVMEETFKTDAEVEAEHKNALLRAKMELHELINQDLQNDEGANQSGLYELRGVVTHQGASADSGHYTAYVKKSAPVDPKTGEVGEEDGKWWWFNDDKVTEVTADKIEQLAGGGESHSALILLYKAVPLPAVQPALK